jgi:hypothetical protein
MFATAVVSRSDVYPDEIPATSFQKNMAPSVGIHDSLEELDSIALRQNQPGEFIQIIIGLKYLKLLLKYNVVSRCITLPPICIEAVYISTIFYYYLVKCIIGVPNPLCESINFNFNDTHVQNIRTATAMAMSNPSAQNVDTLFNLLDDLMDSNNNTSFLNGHQAVEQKHFVLPVSKVTQPQVISQHNFKVDNTDRTLIPSFMLSFPFHPIVPYSHIQWPVMYPKLLHRPNPDFV